MRCAALALFFMLAAGIVPVAGAAPLTPADGTPVLASPGFECDGGIYALPDGQGREMVIPSGWIIDILEGVPWINSASLEFNHGSCGGEAHVERIEGGDSLLFLAPDIETPPIPGKPFDAAVYQQVQVTPGVAYSLSAWMLSLCGGSTMPNDCPDGYYMTKMLGIDPTGGTDARADTVIWVENSQNFVENGSRVGWTNLRTSAVAQAETITLFGRIRSPFQHHGNHAFIDAFSLVRAPESRLEALPTQVEGSQVAVRWDGTQSPDVAAIENGVYELLFDVDYRLGGSGDWVRWQTGQKAGQAPFLALAAGVPHYFRVRVRAEQLPTSSGGAWPNQRYPGVWSEPMVTTFSTPAKRVLLPFVDR